MFIKVQNLRSNTFLSDEEGGGESPNRGRGEWRGGMLWGLWWWGQLLRTFWRENLRSNKKQKNSNDVVMNKTDGMLIQSLWRLWVYRREGELLPGCIHTEHQTLRNIRGMVGTQDTGVLKVSFTPTVKKDAFMVCLCHRLMGNVTIVWPR